MAISKAERKRNAAARRRTREATRKDAVARKVATAAGAYAGQRFFAGMTTPGTATFPIQYAAGGLALVFGMRRQTTGAQARVFDLMEGAALGQLGVMGYQNQTPLFTPTAG